MARTFLTHNDLSETIRKKIVKLLNENLVDAIHLSLQGKQAHWNVKGIYFYQFHELFDKFYDEASDWSDLLAERVVQLGALAEANLDSVAKRTRLPSYSLDLTDGLDHVKALIKSLSIFCKNIRSSIDESQKIGDAGTADLFTEISRSADKFLWFLESHLVQHKKLK